MSDPAERDDPPEVSEADAADTDGRPHGPEHRNGPDDGPDDGPGDTDDTGDTGGVERRGGASAPPDDDRAPTSAIEALTTGHVPRRPPRRTGVFVDPDDLRTHVGELLRAVLGGYEVDAFGNFSFAYEGARVVVTVGPSPVGPQVGIFCVTNLDIDLTPELAALLLTTNHTLGFGSFSYDQGNRAIWLRHTLLGTTLDLPELHTAVAAVATTAAHLDDRIAERFGGRTFDEAPDEVRDRMEPPEPEVTEPRTRGVRGYL